jgi:hypothetical protein
MCDSGDESSLEVCTFIHSMFSRGVHFCAEHFFSRYAFLCMAFWETTGGSSIGEHCVTGSTEGAHHVSRLVRGAHHG